MEGTIKASTLTFSIIIWDGKNTNTEIRVTGNLQEDEAGYIHIYSYFDKWIGDPQPRPFSPHMIELNNIDVGNETAGPIDLTSGAMKLHIDKLYYEVQSSATYILKLTGHWTDSQGQGKVSVTGKTLATLRIC